MKKKAVVAILALALSPLAFAGSANDEETALDRLSGVDIPIQARFEKQKLSTVIGAMAQTAPFEVTYKDGVGDLPVSVNWEKQSLKRALLELADQYGLEYDVPSHGQLVVWKGAIQAEKPGH